MKNYLKNYEYKILYKHILFTCFVLLIYITGTHIPAVTEMKTNTQISTFYRLTAANMGGDYFRINIFSLGLGPWLTAMIVMTLIYYRDEERVMTQTRRERSLKEKLFTLLLSMVQGYFVVYFLLAHAKISGSERLLMWLILITGAMFLVWLSDQNLRYGIAGPMPIVAVSIIRSLFQTNHAFFNIGAFLIILTLFVLMIILLLLIYLELTEYRLPYLDVMNVTAKQNQTYLAWKLNPGGSISIMIGFAVFILLSSAVNMIVEALHLNQFHINRLFELQSPIGITLFLIIQLLLGYVISRLVLNPKRKSRDFERSGNYFPGIAPGQQTENYLKQKANRISWIGTIIVTLIIGIPLYLTLLVPKLTQEIYLSVQIIVLVYICLNIVETVKTYLYFDQYHSFLNRYLR